MTLYQTMKELKDAGFPQEGKGSFPMDDFEWDGSVYLPTLEELIDACGEDFYGLIVLHDQNKWTAHSMMRKDFVEPLLCEASTRIEAVARLWLALNNKK